LINPFFKISLLFILLSSLSAINADKMPPNQHQTKIKISFGLKSSKQTKRTIQLISNSPGLTVAAPTGKGIEPNDKAGDTSLLNYGAGDIDELITEISWPEPTAPLRKLAQHKDGYAINGDAMWGYLMEHGSPGQSARLQQDTWNQPDAPLVTIQLNTEGTEGFTISLQQLIRQSAMWLPEHDIFITLADQPKDFKTFITALTGQRTLDLVHQQQDASLTQFNKLWEDIGNPKQWDVSWQTKYMGTKGHLTVTAAAPGSIYKFAIDRYGNVRPDFASPYKFSLDIVWPGSDWKSQKIVNGLPIMQTVLKKNGQLCGIEQFASPTNKLNPALRGNIPSVLISKIVISGKSGPLNIGFDLDKEIKGRQLDLQEVTGGWKIIDKQSAEILLLVNAAKGLTVEMGQSNDSLNPQIRVNGLLAQGETKEIFITLPSPSVPASELSKLLTIDFKKAKEQIQNYWESWQAKGAQFKVPEDKVNQLYRANLWHALGLPRYTTDSNGNPHMDLPYANTAYGQKNADWPVNQAVYVDYMIYGLRSYDSVADDEIRAMFHSQQQPDGMIGGFANWGVYSPAHLYAIAENYQLSHNNKQFENLLPYSLKTLDWCLAKIKNANTLTNPTGLIRGPLNDLTHDEREWAFTQAYFVGGLEKFAHALSIYKHPRAKEVMGVATKMKTDVVKEFSRSSVKSAVVQLADGSWSNFVPTDAMTPRRMMDQWYPSDVDCGPLHLSRLGVLDPYSWLTTAILNDHEDNLFLKNQGAANEPIYVQQANTYLLRDDPKAVIRAFYSLMACGFSHEQLTSLEHRWAWGQYYGPPSTDGAWFEIYRKMLINEWGSDTLMIGQAIPSDWLTKGKQVSVSNAPTYFGPVSFTIDGLNSSAEINTRVQLSDRNLPAVLLVRLRQTGNRRIRSVTVNGKTWKNFNMGKEYISIPKPVAGEYVIRTKY